VTKKVWILGIPIPKVLQMDAHAYVVLHKDGKGWFFKVVTKLPLIGKLLIQYEGHLYEKSATP
jgi:hypothetical protein